jgi:hypothetical protein
MKKYNSRLKTTLNLALAVLGLALFGHQASAQTTIAQWTFESSGLGSSSPSFVPGANTATTNFYAELGTQAGIAAITGKHLGSATYNSTAGNGSAKSLSANTWTNIGDYYQIAVSTVGFTNINLSFDAVGSATGPRDFIVSYSTDGVHFTQFGSAYTVLSSPTWSSGTHQVGETYTYDLSSVTSLANASIVYIRLVVNSSTAINGAAVGTGGTSRIDNVIVSGTVPGIPSIITSPQNTTNYFGDTVTLTMSAAGSAPLSYFWFTNLNTAALTDGGTISGSATPTLTLSFVNTNQAGNYQVIVSNSIGTATSAVAHVVVNIRTPIAANIAYLHTLHDANFALTDKTNIYVVEGNVTTIGDLNTTTSGEVDSFFVQDSTGGIDVFYRGGFPFPNFGDHVRITAPMDQYSGLLEMAPINGNPAHNVVILGSGSPPAPQYFNFTTLPTPTVMEESIEGRYLVVSNVFLGITNADPHLVGGETIFMTNQTHQVFKLYVANNLGLGPIGYPLPGPFAASVNGVMSQAQSSGTVLTNGYDMILSDFSQIVVGTGPIPLNFQVLSGSLQLTWSDASFSLQSSTNVTGPYTPISGATSPFTTNLTSHSQQFFRLVH